MLLPSPMPASVLRATSLLALGGALALTACEETDLGSKCALLLSQKPITVECADPANCVKMQAGLDYVAFGSGECEDFTCVASPRVGNDGTTVVGGEGYCSRTCAKEGDTCGADDFSCRTLILDQEFLDEIRPKLQGKDGDSNGVDDYQQHFGSIADARYCTRTPCSADAQCAAGQVCAREGGFCTAAAQ